MARVGVISVDLVAHTGKLLKPLREAEKAVGGMASKVRSAARTMATVAAPLAAAAAGFVGAGLSIAKVRREFAAIDEIAKTADKLGLTTERLVGLRHAAEMGGLGVNQFDTALQRMTRRVAEAAQGSGEAKKTLAELGLDPKALNAVGPAAALEQIADKMQNVSNASDRVRIAFKLFDTEGVNMVNVLKGGSAGLQQAQRDAEKLGITLSRADAAKIEMANESMMRLRDLFTGIARKIAIELAPYIKLAADWFVAMGTEGEGWGGKVRAAIQTAINGFESLLNVVQGATRLMAKAWVLVITPIESTVNQIASAINYVVASLQSGIMDAFASLTSFGADVLKWLDSVLPERFQTGLGSIAQQYANEVGKMADEQRRVLETGSFKVDLGLADSANDFLKSVSGEAWGDKLHRRVRQIQAVAQQAAESAVTLPPMLEAETTAAAGLENAAILRGSQQAFKAIAGTKTNKDEEQLQETRRSRETLQRIEREIAAGAVLKSANL